LVLEYHGCRRAGLGEAAVLVFAVLHFPDHFAGLGIQRHEGCVSLILQDEGWTITFRWRIGHTAVDGITAHDRNDVGILFWFVFPKNLAVIVEVEGVYDVGERRIEVHDAVMDERTAFMSAQNTSREGPLYLQIL